MADSINPDQLEIAPGFKHDDLQGLMWEPPLLRTCAKVLKRLSIIAAM